MQIQPRTYQAEAVEACRHALNNTSRALAVMATGLGKTITSALVWRGFKHGHGLFLVHNNGILEHAATEYKRVYGPDKKIALYNGYSKDIDGADIVFATFQTMALNLQQFRPNEFDWMTVDETHHSQADRWRTVVEHFACSRLGITATPNRRDKKDIRQLFGKEVYDLPLEEAIARGLLPPIEYKCLTDESFDTKALRELLEQAKTIRGTIAKRHINKKIFIEARDDVVANTIRNEGRKAIVFCQNIHHAETFAKHFPHAATYHSGKTKERNEGVLAGFRKGVIEQLIVVNSFNEGMDVPNVDLVVFYRSTESETVFRQQLGRGLRPGKSRLMVLDFVGNIDRICYVHALATRVSTLYKPAEASNYQRPRLHITGSGFSFSFTEELISLVELLKARGRTRQRYRTWQEASIATIRLGIGSCTDYYKSYWKDPMLPGAADAYYSDFPGWTIFLGGTPSNYYKTWREAAGAARALGITSSTQYLRDKAYQRDPRLPGQPERMYSKDWPGWPSFLLGDTPYETTQEAVTAIRRLGIRSAKDYIRKYKQDPKLRPKPEVQFKEWPGWGALWGKKARVVPYESWYEAADATQRLGITSSEDYRNKYLQDPRLPSKPARYLGWPGWDIFLDRETQPECYPTWEEALAAVKRLGITTWEEYGRRRTEDPRLPAALRQYYPNCPTFKVFIGHRQPYYPTWKEASEATNRLGIRTYDQYRSDRTGGGYRKDLRLPSCPDKLYRDWPGWGAFLGHERIRPYEAYHEASLAAQSLKIRTAAEYQIRYKEDPRLPCKPKLQYKMDWDEWPPFLGIAFGGKRYKRKKL